MRVIEERSVLMDVELVDERLARFNRVLDESRRTVPLNGNLESMPVNEGRFGQFVGDNDPNSVTLGHLDGRSRHAAVVTVEVHENAGMEFSLNSLRHQLKDLHTIVHPVGQLGNVRCLKRNRPLGGPAKARH